MYIRFYFKVILFILALICIACDIDPLSFDNPQDPESHMHLNEIENIILTSETDTSIAISLGIPEDADKISIERNIVSSVSGKDTSIYDFIFYIDVADYGNGIIDTSNIQLNTEYEYIIRNVSGDDDSEFIKDTIDHKLGIPIIDAVVQKSATKAEIHWVFDQNINDSTAFEEFMIKRQISSQSGTDTTFTVSYGNTDSYGNYVLTDSSVIPHIEYTYTVQAITKSGNITLADTIDFHPIYPELADRDWVPLSLSEISIDYNFSMGDVQYEDYSLSLSRYGKDQEPSEAIEIKNISQENLANFNLSYDDILDSPDVEEEWYYIVQWCNDSYCESDTMKITTLPFRYMVLVPGVDNYEYGENDYLEAVSVDSFYMSIYEVPEVYYSDDEGKNVDKIIEGVGSVPAYKLSWQDAVDYCNDRTIGIMGIDYNKAGFRLPTKYEWEYAASYNADDNDKDYSFRDFDFINRTIANYYNNDGIGRRSVGYFDGEHLDTQDAASSLGIYDLNGNVMEWCNDEGVDSDDTRICKGGGFLTEGSECRNKNEFTYSKDLSHETIGFRTVLSVDEFLEYWKGEN